MKRRAVILMLVVFGLSVSAFSQAPIVTVIKATDLSNVPLSYQGVVQPGSLLYMKGAHGKPGHEPVTPYAVAFNPQTLPVTIAQQDVAKTTKGSLALSLFGFEPAAKFNNSQSLKFDQIDMTGQLISGDQMLDELNKDPLTLKHLSDDLVVQKRFGVVTAQWHVYIVEGVFKTANLNITSSSNTAISLTSGQKIDACDQGASGSTGSTGSTGGKSGGPSAVEEVPNADFLYDTTAATPPGGAAVFCRTTTGSVKLKVSSPIAIGLKLQEVYLYPPNETHPTSYYSFEPAQHIF